MGLLEFYLFEKMILVNLLLAHTLKFDISISLTLNTVHGNA